MLLPSLASSLQRTLKPALVLGLTSAFASAQSPLHLRVCGGAIGTTATYSITGAGGNANAFVLLTSLRRGSFPLSVIDPGDPRTVRVGFDLPAATIVGAINQGEGTAALPLPVDLSLVGVGVTHQALSYPGGARIFDRVSDVAVLSISNRGAFARQSNALAQARALHTVIPSADGYQLVVGGGNGYILTLIGTKTTELYDERSRSFSPGPDLTTERGLHQQTRLRDGRYLLSGGVDRLGQPQASAELFDPARGRFVTTGSMTSKRMAHTATLLPDGKVLVTGGIPDTSSTTTAVTSALRSTELYDPATGTWTAGPNLSIPRATHAAVALGNGRVMVIGGMTWRNLIFIRVPSFSGTCEVYDHNTGTITVTGSMATPRALPGAALLPTTTGNRVLAIGGLTGNIQAGGTATATAERYDPVTGTWSPAGSMPTARALPAVLTMHDGKIGVFGGDGGNLYVPAPLTQCATFDPVAGSWSALPAMNTSRTGASAVLLSGCGIWMLGGGSGSTASTIGTAELLTR